MLSLFHWSQLVLGLIAYTVCLCIYRIYFSPLSHIPGPKLAAAFYYYEAYYDLVKNGRYPWKLRELHKKYGPVIRVTPREVHIQDSDFVEKLYTQKLDKDPWFALSWGIPLAGLSTSSHELHRQRRGAINKFFSKASIASRIDVIQAKILRFCERLESMAKDNEIIQIDAGFICLTLDVIAEFSYGINYNYLDVPGFDRDFKAMLENAFGAKAFNQQFPFVLKAMEALPTWLAIRIMPQVAGIIRLQSMIRTHVRRIIASHKPSPSSSSSSPSPPESIDSPVIQPTIFAQILSSKLPDSEKSESRLLQEGQTLVAAGSETTSRVLYLSLFHLLEQPHSLRRLKSELKSVMPSPASVPTLQQLEQLPFLTAVIKEGIRLSGSTVSRMARMSPGANPITYGGYVFPEGTPVSVTLFDVMMDESIFPEPERFEPGRWLVEDEGGNLKANAGLERYFLAFSKGPRSCVGMWLAWAELYLTMAQLHRRFELELFETGVEDVEAAVDRFSCFAKPGNRGVRVRVTGLVEV